VSIFYIDTLYKLHIAILYAVIYLKCIFKFSILLSAVLITYNTSILFLF